jgi:hypothetical protein
MKYMILQSDNQRRCLHAAGTRLLTFRKSTHRQASQVSHWHQDVFVLGRCRPYANMRSQRRKLLFCGHQSAARRSKIANLGQEHQCYRRVPRGGAARPSTNLNHVVPDDRPCILHQNIGRLHVSAANYHYQAAKTKCCSMTRNALRKIDFVQRAQGVRDLHGEMHLRARRHGAAKKQNVRVTPDLSSGIPVALLKRSFSKNQPKILLDNTP